MGEEWVQGPLHLPPQQVPEAPQSHRVGAAPDTKMETSLGAKIECWLWLNLRLTPMGKGKLPLGSLALGEKEGGNNPGGQEENIPEPSSLALQTLSCVTLTSLILKSYKCQEGGFGDSAWGR